MGVDCYIINEKYYLSLDRWYVFSSVFESRKKYLREEVLSLLNKIKIPEDDESYYSYWIEHVKESIKDTKVGSVVVFYKE